MMRRGRVALSLVCLLLSAGFAFGQEKRGMRINEVMLLNTDSYMDNYGHRGSWVELHNTGYASVNIGGWFLKLIRERGDTITYKIPRNDPRTWVASQDYVLFFCEGNGFKGTFYTNFIIEGKGRLELYGASGRGEPVDAIDFDEADAKPDVSMGWLAFEQGKPEQWVFELPQTTPGSTNNTQEYPARSEIFRLQDPVGVIMALTAMTVVFLALIMLYQVFKQLGIFMVRRSKRGEKATLATDIRPAKVPVADEEIPAEIVAAIGLALRRYETDLLEMESTVLTINRVAKAYSPWNSKIYGIQNQPIKNSKR